MKKIFLYFSILITTSVFSQLPTTGLMGYWPFHGDAADSSGNNNHGTVYNASLVVDRFGNCNQAYQFDGINDYIIVPNSSYINFTNTSDFTVAFWIKIHQNNFDGIPLSKNQYGSFAGYQFYVNINNPGYCSYNKHASFYTASGANQDACSDNPIDTNWHFFTGVYDHASNNSVFYVDAVPQADIGHSVGNMSTTANLYFGSNTIGTNKFTGTLDAIRIYNRTLSQNEIDLLFHEPDPGSSVIGNYSMNDTTICNGDTVTISPGAAASYTWSTGSNTPSITTDTSGKYWVNYTTNDGCLKTDTVQVTVVDSISINLVSDTVICSDPILIQIKDTTQNITWWNGSHNNSVIISSAGTYSLSVKINGCEISDSFQVNFANADETDILPNVFTPNNDGINDFFELNNSKISLNSIKIYNRWGKLVFQDSKSNFKWDGKQRNGLIDDGVYFWIISYKPGCAPTDKIVEKTGFVSVFK